MDLLYWLEDPEPNDPPLYAGAAGDPDEPDDEPPDTWATHPSLTPEQRNSRFHCQ